MSGEEPRSPAAPPELNIRFPRVSGKNRERLTLCLVRVHSAAALAECVYPLSSPACGSSAGLAIPSSASTAAVPRLEGGSPHCPDTDRRGTTSPLLNSCIPAFSSPPFPEVRGAVSSHAPGGQKMAAAARRPRRFARQGFPLLGNAAVERRRFHPSGLQGCDQGTRDTARGVESHRRRLSTKSSVREEPCKHRPGMERCLLFQAGWIFTGGFCGF